MNLFELILILLFIKDSIQVLASSYIKLQYTRSEVFYKISFYLGDNEKEQVGIIDINSNVTYFISRNRSYYSSKLFETIPSQPIYIDKINETILGKKVSDLLILNMPYDNDYLNLTTSFYLIENSTLSFNVMNTIGLSSDLEGKTSSILHQMKQKGMIDRLAFTFIKSDMFKGTLYFGTVPSTEIAHLYHSYCQVIGQANQWDCLIPQIIFHKNSQELYYNNTIESSHLYFTTKTDYIYAPKEFIDELYNLYFRDAITNKDCFLYRGKTINQIACEDYFIDKMGNITFVIGNYAYKLGLWTFWYCDEVCYFQIILNKESNNWIIGTDFLNSYSISFDYEDKRVHFYSKKDVWKISKENEGGIMNNFSKTKTSHTIAIIFININSIILSFGIIAIRILIKR